MPSDDTHRQTRASIGGERQSTGSKLDRDSAELSARTVQRLSVLGEMTGGIVHDFRNILAIIDSGLRLAESNIGDADRVRSFISGARDGVARGLSLTQQLLSFAQQGEIHTCAADANALLRSLERFLKYGAGPAVRVVLDCLPEIPKCIVDPSQFTAAILNLVINARDAMPGGGVIWISTALVDARRRRAAQAANGIYIRVRVQDNGPGMPDHVVQRIFEPFFTTKGPKGTGLGIPQVRSFMRHIGGYIDVASRQGSGTTIDLFFPAVEPDNALSANPHGEPTAPLQHTTRHQLVRAAESRDLSR
jgi:signal transduction histidine kinase